MFKKFKIVFKIIEWVLFAVLLCLLFIVISPKLPIKNIPKSFVVVSGSMEPTIKTGSVAFTREVDAKTIKVGDIIAFTSPSDLKDTILHRVNSISSANPLLFKTKGDNNNDIDAWDVQDIGVKGVYITAIPYLGSIAAFIKTPLGFVLVIGIPALIFIIFQLLNIKKAISEEVDRKVSQKLKEDETQNLKNNTFKSILFFILFSATIFGLNHLATAKALYSDTVVVSGITISIADFTKPTTPSNLHWSNPDVSCGGYTNTHTILPDWDKSDDIDKVKYEYEISYDKKDGSDRIWKTFFTDASPYSGIFNQSEGSHSFRVRAYDNNGNISDWSSFCSVTLDKTIPESTIVLPVESKKNNIDINIPTIPSWNGKIEGIGVDNLSGVDSVELSIQNTDTKLFWNGNDWINATEETVRVDATGNTNWSYQINPQYITFGKFKIVSHAVDKAGNIENSATIEFEYTDSPPTDINVVSNRLANKINLEITNISSPLDYEIFYTGNGVEKGIFGHVNIDEILDSKYSKDFYLGTCSDGGCTPEIVEVGSGITVNLTGGSITFNKKFNY